MGAENLKSMFIKINGIKDVQDFVAAAMAVDGAVLIKKGAYCVDGTSILGMFSIDTSKGVTVEYPATAKAFEEFVQQFAC